MAATNHDLALKFESIPGTTSRMAATNHASALKFESIPGTTSRFYLPISNYVPIQYTNQPQTENMSHMESHHKLFNYSKIDQKDTTNSSYQSSEVKSEGEEKNIISYHANTTDEKEEDNMYEQEEKDMVSECVETIQQDKESKVGEKVTSWCEETMSWTHDDKTMTWDDFVEMCKNENK